MARGHEKPNGVNGEQVIDPIVLASKTLSGDLRDYLLDRIRNLPRPWQRMTEAEQKTMGWEVDDFCRDLVRHAVQLIAADGRVTILASLDTVAVKSKGIEAKFILGRSDPNRHALVDAQGSPVLIVVADAAKFLGQRAAPKIDPQQPELPVEPAAAEAAEAP